MEDEFEFPTSKNLREYLTKIVELDLKFSIASEGAGKNDDDPAEVWVKDSFSIHFRVRSDGKVNVERSYAEMDTSPMGCGMDDENGNAVYADLAELMDGVHPEWFDVG